MFCVVTLQLKPATVVYLLNLIAIIVMIFRERRKPQSILVWSLAFYALPVVAFVFYIFIGRGPSFSKKKKYLGKVLANEKYYKILEESYATFENAPTDVSDDTKDFIKFCTKYNNSPCLIFNDMEVFTDISMQYERMIEDIANASNIYWIQFDNDVKLRLWDYKYFDESIYEVVSKKKGARSLRYAFTDDDYQYALENGTVLEF